MVPSATPAPDPPHRLKGGGDPAGPDGHPSGGDASDPHGEEEARDDARRVFRCARCGTEVAEERDVFAAGRDSVDVYVNLHGFVHEVLTVRRVRNALPIGHPTSEMTWFAGYAWRHLLCARCGSHLGWHYLGVSGSDPAEFFGLRRTEIR